MSNFNMSYHPLKNISKVDQVEYYPNILKIGKDHKELENLLTQYKNTYQEFVNTSKNITRIHDSQNSISHDRKASTSGEFLGAMYVILSLVINNYFLLHLCEDLVSSNSFYI